MLLQSIMQNIAGLSSYRSLEVVLYLVLQFCSVQVSMLCESFETYVQGLPLAHKTLEGLRAEENFKKFLTFTAQECGIELHEALDIPVQVAIEFSCSKIIQESFGLQLRGILGFW